MRPRPPGAGAVILGALATRLLALGGIFALAVLSELAGSAGYSERTLTALYALVLAGFAAMLGYALLASAGRTRLLGWLELVGDGVLITALVYCTGGARSVFGFLYVAWIVYGAIRAGAAGAAATPVAAAAGYGAVALALAWGWLPALEPDALSTKAEALWAVARHAVAFLIVALLAHRLAVEVRRGRDELKELGEIHHRIVDNVSSGLLALDAAGCIASFNREAERITGYPQSEVVGWPLARLFPSLEALAQPQAAGDGALSRMQIQFENRAGERLHLGLSCSVVRDARGEPEGAVLIFQDLTRVVRMEEELRRSERLAAVGQLAAGLAHELRNPLASLSGSIELLQRGLPELGDDAKRLVTIVQRETGRLNRLVVDFLAYARPAPVRVQPVVLAELLGELALLLARRDSGRVRLQLDAPAELAAQGDPDQLRQVFWNLVLNAVEAEPRDGVVWVRVARAQLAPGESPQVEIAVADRGVGIAPDVLERVFEPFFTTKPTGTGLGLATVHRIVEAHGGSLELQSEPGCGTSVRVRLPAARGVKPATVPADRAPGGVPWLESS